jgi:hypothetical protein
MDVILNTEYLSVGAQPSLMCGLRGYWKLNDSSSPLVDIYAGNNLTETGTPLYQQTGILDYSVSFNSDGDYFKTLTTGTAIFPNTDRFSVSYWIYLNALPSSGSRNYGIFSRSSTLGTVYARIPYTGSTTDSMLFTILNKEGAYSYHYTSDFLATAWYHIVIVVEPGTVKLYKNGNEDIISGGTWTGSLDNPSGPVYLGTTGASTTEWLNGFLDEFGVWNRALTQAEVTTLYNSGTGLTYPFA